MKLIKKYFTKLNYLLSTGETGDFLTFICLFSIICFPFIFIANYLLGDIFLYLLKFIF